MCFLLLPFPSPALHAFFTPFVFLSQQCLRMMINQSKKQSSNLKRMCLRRHVVPFLSLSLSCLSFDALPFLILSLVFILSEHFFFSSVHFLPALTFFSVCFLAVRAAPSWTAPRLSELVLPEEKVIRADVLHTQRNVPLSAFALCVSFTSFRCGPVLTPSLSMGRPDLSVKTLWPRESMNCFRIPPQFSYDWWFITKQVFSNKYSHAFASPLSFAASGTYFILSGQHLFTACARIALERSKASKPVPKYESLVETSSFCLFSTRFAQEFLCQVAKPTVDVEGRSERCKSRIALLLATHCRSHAVTAKCSSSTDHQQSCQVDAP